MNIAYLRSLPIGNAVEVAVNVDLAAVEVRILRRLDALFAGPDDSDAIVIADHAITPGIQSPLAVLDLNAVQNGTPYFYCAYERIGAVWTSSPVQSVTPQPYFTDRTVDPLLAVRDRLIVGLQAEVAAGRLHPASGAIPVWTAPPQAEMTAWPVVTLRVDSDHSVERFIGEQIDADHRLTTGDWLESEGWLSQSTLTVIGWSQNPDERIALRLALKRIIIGNLPVFAAMGLITPDWNQQDNEDFQTYNAPVYQTVGTFTCLAPSALTWTTPDIDDITVFGSPIL